MITKVLLIILAVAAAFLALILLFLLLLAVSMLFVNPNKLYNRQTPYFRFLRDITDWIIIFFSHIRVTVIRKEKLPADRRYLMVSNHRSNYDPLCVLYGLREENIIFISKPENFDIPVIGRLARVNCFRPIDRENARNALVTIKDCAALLRDGAGPIGVYPEGTRSKTCEMLPFHNSVFKVAQDADAPIVVITVKGTEIIHSRAPWRRTDVTLEILDVLPAEHVKGSRTAVLGEEIRAMMLENLK